MGSNVSSEISPCTPVGCILKYWNKFVGNPLTRKRLRTYSTLWQSLYKLEDGEAWPENGTLNYNVILQLMLFCQGLEKWEEVPYVDLIFVLRNNHEIRKKCKLLTEDLNGILVLADKRKKKEKCCEACEIDRKRMC